MITKIAVIGQQCSGKTSAAKFFSKHFDAKFYIKIADPLYDVLDAFKQPKHRAFMQQVADLGKKHFGEQFLVEIFVKNVEDIERVEGNRHDNVLIVCDDVRFPYEIIMARDLGFHLVAIDADVDVRKARSDRLGLDFIENHNSELLVPQLIPKADFIIKDDGISMEKLHEKCKEILVGIENQIMCDSCQSCES